MRSRQALVLVAAVLIGVAVGVLVTWALGLADRTQIEVLEGEALVNEEGTAIGLSPDGDTPGLGYVVAGAMWRKQGGAWHDTFPTCLEPLTTGQEVRLGVLQAPAEGEAPGRPYVVWLECLD
jgi:hypothetical protein